MLLFSFFFFFFSLFIYLLLLLLLLLLHYYYYFYQSLLMILYVQIPVFHRRRLQSRGGWRCRFLGSSLSCFPASLVCLHWFHEGLSLLCLCFLAAAATDLAVGVVTCDLSSSEVQSSSSSIDAVWLYTSSRPLRSLCCVLGEQGQIRASSRPLRFLRWVVGERFFLRK